MNLMDILLLASFGFISGWINTVAGGGSLLNILTMLFIGISGSTANGTNRLAVLFQSIAAIGAFLKSDRIHFRPCLLLAIFTSVGAFIGAHYGVKINDIWFDRFLALLIVIIFLIIQGKQRGFKKGKLQAQLSRINPLLGYILLIAAGFWGGLIQVGVGFLLIPILHFIFRYDLVVTNAYKTFIIFTYTIFALTIFETNDMINWQVGMTIALGSLIGGWYGAKATMKLDEIWIYRLIKAGLIIFFIKLLFF
tara:strand:- start:61057 stop:61809 length:753 start_codon:yes stop_codon:yes gene_type:complete